MSNHHIPSETSIPPLPEGASPTSTIIAAYTRLKGTLKLEHPDPTQVFKLWGELRGTYEILMIRGSRFALYLSHWPALVSAGFIPGILDLTSRTVQLDDPTVSDLACHPRISTDSAIFIPPIGRWSYDGAEQSRFLLQCRPHAHA